jgi:hypothetical protein
MVINLVCLHPCAMIDFLTIIDRGEIESQRFAQSEKIRKDQFLRSEAV